MKMKWTRRTIASKLADDEASFARDRLTKVVRHKLDNNMFGPFDTGINPATGLPLITGGSLDVAGNVYGTSSNSDFNFSSIGGIGGHDIDI